MKFYDSLPVADVSIELPTLDAMVDVAELRRIMLRNLVSLVEFDTADPAQLEEAFEARFGLSQKLRSQDPSLLCDLEAYLTFDTQGGYIDELRAALRDS